jgi:hypothetical protein
MMWLSLALCMEMVVTTLALITLGLSAPYAVQLWRAPPYEGTTATGSFR